MSPQLDRADARVTHATGLSGTIKAFMDRVKSGDLGSLPVVVGLAIIWTVFTALNPIFLSPNNLVNSVYGISPLSKSNTTQLERTKFALHFILPDRSLGS